MHGSGIVRVRVWFVLLLLLLPYSSEAQTEAPVKIRNVTITNLGVFDPKHEEFRWWIFRFLNRTHVKTRPSFIRNELLLKEGDILLPDLVRESERNLRRYRFLTDVSVKAVRVNDRESDLHVSTEDQWTTLPSFSWGKTRGARTFDAGIAEENFLGLGRRVGVLYEDGPERSGFSAMYGDPRFLNTRMRFNFRLSDFSDGHRLSFGLAQPFHTQESRWSYGAHAEEWTRLQHFYYRGIDAAALESIQKDTSFQLSHAWGARYQRNRAGVLFGYFESLFPSTVILDPEAAEQPEIQDNLDPDERRLFNIGLNIDRDRQRFSKFYYVDNFGRTEDLPYGTLSGLSIVRSNNGKGPDYVTGAVHGRYATRIEDRLYFASGATFSVRRQSGEWNNQITDLFARYYLQSGPKNLWLFHSRLQTLAAGLSATLTSDMDAPFQLSLGEDEGLRGYQFKDFTGLNRILLNVEYRIMTPWENRLVGIGIVPFWDAGYVWNPDSHWGTSVGLGLRIGFKKYGRTRVIRIDYAFPLVNTQNKSGSLSISTGHVFNILP